MLFESLDRVLDVGGLLLDHVDLYSTRELPVESLELFLNVIHYFDRIHAGLTANVENHGRLVLVISKGAPLRHAVFRITHVTNPDRRSANVLHNNVAEFLHVLDATHSAHAEFGGTAHDASTR